MAFSSLYASKKLNEKLKEITTRIFYLGKGVNHPNGIAKPYVANVHEDLEFRLHLDVCC